MKRFIPIFVFVVLPIITFFVTKTLLVRSVQAQSGNDLTNLDTSCIVSAPTMCYTNFQGGTQTVQGTAIPISAQLNFLDTAETDTFVWFVNVTNAGGTESIFYASYDDSPVTVPAGTQVNPTFTANIPVNPGYYSVTTGIQQNVTLVDINGNPSGTTSIVLATATCVTIVISP